MQTARLQLRLPREARTQMVRQYVGTNYAEEGAQQKILLNLISLYVSIVSRALIPKEPRVMMSTFDKKAKPAVAQLQDFTNEDVKQKRVDGTLRRIVVDALFSIGIAKVALATPTDSASMSWRLKAGEPFIERVDLDDFVFDFHARDFSEVNFIGHRFRAPLRAVLDSPIYDAKAKKKLTPARDELFNMEGDERINVIGRGTYGIDSEEFEDHVDLWEVYLPQHKVVLTLTDNHLAGIEKEPLRGQNWLGSDQGPYHILGYLWVPGNPMHKGPLQDLFDLHMSINRIYRKIDNQAMRQKTNTFYAGSANEDATRKAASNDGELVQVNSPDKLKQVESGGPNQANLQLGVHYTDLFMKLAGNLEMMGGLAPQSKTLGQDQMLQQNASGQVSEMQKDTINFTSDVLRSYIWYLKHDPKRVLRTEYVSKIDSRVGFARESHPAGAQSPDGKPLMTRDFSFDETKIMVDPYSMMHSTPQARRQNLIDLVTKIFQPLAQLAQQQSIGLDLNAFFKKIGEYDDDPDYQDILTLVEPPPQEDVQGGGQPGGAAGVNPAPKPAETTRNYVRRSLGGQTADNRLATLQHMTSPSQPGQPSMNGVGA